MKKFLISYCLATKTWQEKTLWTNIKNPNNRITCKNSRKNQKAKEPTKKIKKTLILSN
jgi:hypothetical protein